MKAREKKLAIKLRKEGKTYREILKKISVSTGTLSLWLRDFPLSEKQLNRIKNLEDTARERASISIKKKWREKHSKIYNEYDPPFYDPFFMLGLGIYMGEGSKYSRCTAGLSNSEYKFLLIYKEWIERFFAEDTLNWRGYVATHSYENNDKIKKWWAKKLKLPLKQFSKTVVSISRASKRKRNNLKYGTFHLRVGGKNTWKIACKIKKSMNTAPVV